MSQAAATLMMNLGSVQQDQLAIPAKTARSGTVHTDQTSISSPEGISNESSNMVKGKDSFKELLQKRIPSDTGVEPKDSDKTKPEKNRKIVSTKSMSAEEMLLAAMGQNVPVQTKTAMPELKGDIESGLRRLRSPQKISAIAPAISVHRANPAPIQGNNQPNGSSTAIPEVVSAGESIPKFRIESKTRGHEIKGTSEKLSSSTSLNNKLPATDESQIKGVPQDPGKGITILKPVIEGNNESGKTNPFSSPHPSNAEFARKNEKASRNIENPTNISDKSKNTQKNQVGQKTNTDTNGDPVELTQMVSNSQNHNKSIHGYQQRITPSQNPVSSIENTQSVTDSAGKQVVTAIQAQINSPSPQQEVTITLNPPELGKVKISFQQNNGEITGLLEVERPRTQSDIQKELPQVLMALQSAGVQVRKLDIVTQSPNQQPNPEQPNHHGHPQGFDDGFMHRKEQFSDQSQGQTRTMTGSNAGAGEGIVETDNLNQRNSFVSDDAINMFV